MAIKKPLRVFPEWLRSIGIVHKRNVQILILSPIEKIILKRAPTRLFLTVSHSPIFLNRPAFPPAINQVIGH